MVRRHPVLEAVRAPGVLRHVAAQGRRLLAGGIGQELVAQGRQGIAQLQVEHARLHPGPEVHRVHLQQLVHADHLDDHPASKGDGAPAQVRAAAPGQEGDSLRVADLDDRSHFLRGVDEHHGVGAPLLQVGVVLVELQVHGRIEDIRLTNDLPQGFDENTLCHGQLSGVGMLGGL